MKPMRTACALCLILLFAACIPASPPANVSATPGEAAVITQNSYANTVFNVSYPTGWRVITSPAGAPPSVTLVAPGNCALIIVSSAPVAEAALTSPSCEQANIKTITQDVTLGSQQIVIAGSAPADGWDNFLNTVNRIATSVRSR